SKSFIITLANLLIFSSLFAQSPEKMSYQAVVRDASDVLVTNTSVGMQISILQGSPSGTAVYVETQTPTSNANGLVSLEIGTGTLVSGDFATIDWANDTYFIKTETDPVGGTSYTITGISQLLSVPYALHAKTAETVTGVITETDPVFTAWDKDYEDLTNTPVIIAVPENVGDFTNDVGYLTEYTETDPVFTAWDKDYEDLTNTPVIIAVPENVGDFTNDVGYLTEYTETDPVFTAWDKDYEDLINLPATFDGDYNNLSNAPTVISDFTLDANAQNITNLADPVNNQDAATKAYVDQLLNLFLDNGMVVIDFSVSATNVTLGNSIDFTDNSVLEATSWLWDFGDGNTSTEQNPTYTYTIVGIYTVSLTASNGVLSSTETKDDYITVIDVPIFNSFTDSRDGTEYQTIIIGNQEWMAENLAYLPSVVDDGTGSNSIAYYYVYDYDGTDVVAAKATANYDTYGVLYNWTAVMAGSVSSVANPSGVQGVCPTGWHLPSDTEWTELTDYLGGASDAGGKLKENGTTHWDDPNLGVTTENGFAALPGGYRGTNVFDGISTHGFWWSTSESDWESAYNRAMYYNGSGVYRYNFGKDSGLSVRCVKD
ncbi:MAG: FISUMP domain-containing protein, partial [Bacteroidales bacterium]|nr:FISUMP domain-containing protein [Bacteroidales bacterium]